MLEINGALMEGGGQILRTSLSLSVILQKPCRVFNIRQGREKPGLSHQHLLAAQSLARLCGGSLQGDELGSQEVKFYPSSSFQKNALINIPTAGSISLILQALIPLCSVFPFPFGIKINGGASDTFFSPTSTYLQEVFLKFIGKMGIETTVQILKKGYYPEGGAKVTAKINPSKIKPLNLTERGNLIKIIVISEASESLREKKVAERQAVGIREILGKLKLPTTEKISYFQTECPGSNVCLVAEFENTIIGTDNLGRLGKRAEDVGKETALELLRQEKTKACLDKRLADQILIYLALCPKKSRIVMPELTSHCKTNMKIIEIFTGGSFKTKEDLLIWQPKK